MIDSHSHTYSKDFETDFEEMIARAKEAGVTKIFMPAIDSETYEAMMSANRSFPDLCLPMIGLHPCSVKENFEQELELIENRLKENRFYAIGETGLDFYWDKTFTEQQYIALRRQIEWALRYDLPLVLHTRNATPETIDVIKEFSGSGLRGVFHCFGGSLQEAEEIIALNFLLGIGGVVTYKNSGLDKVLPHISLQHIVLETDAPYLAPVPYRGKRNEPAYLPKVAEAIAGIKNIKVVEVIAATTANAEGIFNKS